MNHCKLEMETRISHLQRSLCSQRWRRNEQHNLLSADGQRKIRNQIRLITTTPLQFAKVHAPLTPAPPMLPMHFIFPQSTHALGETTYTKGF